jgi:cytochrome c biogenesis protein CcmG/thiol:disulfide interchange protein DsbE
MIARRNILVLMPLLAFAGLAALFFMRLGAGDASRLPSALIGHPAPKTDLPPVVGLERSGKAVPGLSNTTLEGAVTLVNVWASWCVPCADEVPFLDQLSKDKRIQLVGINYKDSADNARRFLNRYGNPFVATGADSNGRTSIDWGVYGVPENFVVGRDGRIAYKLVGPITAENFAKVLKPEIEKALAR